MALLTVRAPLTTPATPSLAPLTTLATPSLHTPQVEDAVEHMKMLCGDIMLALQVGGLQASMPGACHR